MGEAVKSDYSSVIVANVPPEKVRQIARTYGITTLHHLDELHSSLFAAAHAASEVQAEPRILTGDLKKICEAARALQNAIEAAPNSMSLINDGIFYRPRYPLRKLSKRDDLVFEEESSLNDILAAAEVAPVPFDLALHLFIEAAERLGHQRSKRGEKVEVRQTKEACVWLMDYWENILGRDPSYSFEGTERVTKLPVPYGDGASFIFDCLMAICTKFPQHVRHAVRLAEVS